MRKVFGFFIALVAVVFLGMAYSQLAHAETSTCDSVLGKKIVELVKADQSKILEMQFELTALKLARETLKANQKTTESYIKKQEALIAKLDDQGVREKLKVLYRTFGEADDSEKIEKALQTTVDKTKGASYFKKATRFKNKDLSAYVLAHVLSNEKSAEYDMTDAAILWFHSEISEGVEAKTFRGSAAANLQEVSTRVAQLTGVAGTTGKSMDEIMQLIADMEQIIGEEFDRMKTLFTDEEKKACAELEKCTNCKVEDEEARIGGIQKKAMNKALTSIVENIQKDPTAREAAIQKVMGELKTSGVALERDPEEVKTAEKNAENTGNKTPGVFVLQKDSISKLSTSHDSVHLVDPTADTLLRRPKYGLLNPSSFNFVTGYSGNDVSSPELKGDKKENTAAIIERIQRGRADLPSATLFDQRKYKRYPQTYQNCIVSYAVIGSQVEFRVSSKNSVTACKGSYSVPVMVVPENAWDNGKAVASCGAGKSAVDLKEICSTEIPAK